MSIELAATEDVIKTLCEREREPGTGKHKHERKSNPSILTNTFAENMCYIIKTL